MHLNVHVNSGKSGRTHVGLTGVLSEWKVRAEQMLCKMIFYQWTFTYTLLRIVSLFPPHIHIIHTSKSCSGSRPRRASRARTVWAPLQGTGLRHSRQAVPGMVSRPTGGPLQALTLTSATTQGHAAFLLPPICGPHLSVVFLGLPSSGAGGHREAGGRGPLAGGLHGVLRGWRRGLQQGSPTRGDR